MKTDKVTREDLRALHHGESRTFELPTFAAVQSAKSSAYILGHMEGCRFACTTDPAKNSITITRYDR